MQRKLIFLVLFVTMLFSFVGCTENKDSGENNNPTSGENSEAIYAPSTPLNIVFGNGCSQELILKLREAIYSESNVRGNVSSTTSASNSEHTIFIGRTGSELSNKAYELLDTAIEETRFDSTDHTIAAGYIYYVKGNSVAIAFSEDMYESTVDIALNSFIKDYVNGNKTLILPQGANTTIYDYLEFLKTLDEKYYEAAWNKLSDELNNPQLVESLKKLKNLYGSKVVTWIANLYDEEIGGFYYSNSGRNNQGFLPDVDSTYQALVLVGHTGMQGDFGYGSATWPEGLLEKVGSFAKRLQDENGFFYHPQWTKELTDSKTTRRARDLERALALIKWAGMTPTYDAPDGTKGDGLVWNDKLQSFVPIENLTEPMSSSVASAVSKVVSVNTTYIPNELKTEAAFRSYLASKEGQNMYKVNHELASLTSQIKERDRQLESEGASWRIAPILIEWLNDKQNPINGTWSNENNQNAIDGLFKAAHIYKNLGYELPNAMQAAMSALRAIVSENDTNSAVSVYNCWSTVLIIMNNMKQFGAPDNAKVVLDEVRKVAAESIEATLTKQIQYAKQDRSFSYYKDSCAAESQGMQVALAVNEGDMNATSLSYSIWGTIFECLDISDFEIAIHASADYALFVETIVGIGGVIKDPAPEPETVTFDDDTIGSVSTEVTYTLASEDATASVIRDPRTGSIGNVLELKSNPGAGDAVFVNVADKVSLGSCFIFEGEFCITDAKDGYVMQINLGSSCYMLNLKIVNSIDENGSTYKKIQMLEASSQNNPRIERDLGISARLGEWFKIRYEYYVGSHDSVRIKVYFNDTLAAVTDNYYDHKGVKITSGTGSPKRYYNYTQMNVMSAQQATVLMDNLFVAKTEDRYVPEHDLDNQPLINCDPPDRDELIYDFEDLNSGKNYPKDFTVTESEGSVEVAVSDEGNKLNIKNLGSQNSPSLYLPAVTRTARTNCAVAEMNVIANSGSVGSAINLRLRANDIISGDTGAITAFNLEIKEIGGEIYVIVCEAPNGNSISQFENTKIKLGEEFKIRIEYYEDAHVSLIYINDTLAASSDALSSGGGARSYARLEISALDGGNIDVLIDDLKAERIVKSFLEATKPTKGEIVYDFESGVADATTDGKIIDATTGKALSLSSGSVITLPMNVRAVITNFYRFSFDADFGKNGEYRVVFLSETGKYILSFDLVSKDGKVYIYEFTENGRATKPIASFDETSMANLAFEYYPGEKVCQIIYSNSCIAVTSVTYSSESRYLDIANSSVISLSGDALVVDNCLSECYSTSFVPRTPSSDNEEDDANEITFESSSTGNIPSAITYKLVSLGADVRIEEMLNKKRDVTKALAFDSTSDAGGDELNIKITDSLEDDWNALIFESDIKFNAGNLDKISYQIFFEGDDSSNISRQYLTSISCSDGTLKLKDYSYNSSTSTVQIDGQDAKVNRNDGVLISLNHINTASDWFNLRIEIFEGSRNEMRIFIYVNDDLIYVTNNFYLSHLQDAPNDIANVSRVRFLALASCEASLILDNISFVQATKEMPTDTADAIIKLYSTTNKPTIIAPENPNEKTPEKITYNDGKVYGNTTAEDKNGTNAPTLEVKDGKLYFISDGGDYLYITPTVKNSKYNHVSFEADLTFVYNTLDITGKKTLYTFTVRSQEGGNSYRFNIEYDIESGTIKFLVFNTNKTYATVQMKKNIGTPGYPGLETVTLNYRLEYHFIGTDVVILNYFDDNLVYAVNSRADESYTTANGLTVDHNTYFYYSATGNSKPYNTFTKIEINSHSGTNTILTLDNLRFVQDNKELDETLVEPYYDPASCIHKDDNMDRVCDKCHSVYYDPTTCEHIDDNFDTECDNCGITYYTEATCPDHKDENTDHVCDLCSSIYYDPATCVHIDLDGNAICDNCKSVYYTEQTCPGHIDANGNTVCDNCGCRFADPATCKHKDSDGDNLCDKCEIIYHNPATCEHKDEDEDGECDKCGLSTNSGGSIGDEFENDNSWT